MGMDARWLTFCHGRSVSWHVESAAHADHTSNTIPNSIAVKTDHLCKVRERTESDVGYAPCRFGFDQFQSHLRAAFVRELQLWMVHGSLVRNVQICVTFRNAA